MAEKIIMPQGGQDITEGRVDEMAQEWRATRSRKVKYL